MRWQGRRKSDNVEDRRGVGVCGLAVGGGLELQADFLERGNLEEGINAAASVGDDHIQRRL